MEKFTIRIPEEFTIRIPDGYEIDKKNSNSEYIKLKKKKEIKTWGDLCECSKSSDEVRVSGHRISDYSNIYEANRAIAGDHSRNIFLTEKEAKSSLAMSQISQLMPYYGGAITNEEWCDIDKQKYAIERVNNTIRTSNYRRAYCYLAFHTAEQRSSFLENNEQLVKDYLMLD